MKKISMKTSIVIILLMILLSIFILLKTNLLFKIKLHSMVDDEIFKEEFNVYDISYIDINEEEMINSLQKNGWSGLGTTEDNNDKIDRELTLSLSEIAEQFLKDSGLKEILDNNNLNYEIETDLETTKENDPMGWILIKCGKLDSYIRLIVEGNKICTEYKIYLYTSNLIGKKESVKIEDVLSKYEIDSYSKLNRCSNISLIYREGIPYYDFSYIEDPKYKGMEKITECAVKEE